MNTDEIYKPVSRMQRSITEIESNCLSMKLPKLKRSVARTYTIEQLEKEEDAHDDDDEEYKASLDSMRIEFPEHVYYVEHNGKEYLRSATNCNVYNSSYCCSNVVVGRWNEVENKVELVEDLVNKVELVEDLVNKIAELEAKIALIKKDF